jgi:hypothetical protein
MQELTDLSILHTTAWLDLPPPALLQLSRLRKLTLNGGRWTDEWQTEVKQLSHLRELDVPVLQSAQVIALVALFHHRPSAHWTCGHSCSSFRASRRWTLAC